MYVSSGLEKFPPVPRGKEAHPGRRTLPRPPAQRNVQFPGPGRGRDRKGGATRPRPASGRMCDRWAESSPEARPRGGGSKGDTDASRLVAPAAAVRKELPGLGDPGLSSAILVPCSLSEVGVRLGIMARAGMERWRGRLALVTGASGGIGAAVARALVQQGLKVVGCARTVGNIEVRPAGERRAETGGHRFRRVGLWVGEEEEELESGYDSALTCLQPRDLLQQAWEQEGWLPSRRGLRSLMGGFYLLSPVFKGAIYS